MKKFKAATTRSFLSLLTVGVLALCGMANAEHFSFSGHREDTGQSATISFEMDEQTGSITNGVFHLDKVCEQNFYLAGGDLTFEGTRSNIALDGHSNTCGGGQPHDCGHGKMWYDSYYGVVMQWKSDCQYGVDTNFIFKTSTNPF
jgi:hypothetical protein